MCSQGFPQLELDTDRYYTNFIIGRVQFWQSPLILELGRFLSEFQPGFYKYRWTDQIFFHYAMGLFLQNFTDHVLDYTDLRCAPRANCWTSISDVETFGEYSYNRCDNGGHFAHVKTAGTLGKCGEETVTELVLDQSNSTLYSHTYQHNCSKKKG